MLLTWSKTLIKWAQVWFTENYLNLFLQNLCTIQYFKFSRVLHCIKLLTNLSQYSSKVCFVFCSCDFMLMMLRRLSAREKYQPVSGTPTGAKLSENFSYYSCVSSHIRRKAICADALDSELCCLLLQNGLNALCEKTDSKFIDSNSRVRGWGGCHELLMYLISTVKAKELAHAAVGLRFRVKGKLNVLCNIQYIR